MKHISCLIVFFTYCFCLNGMMVPADEPQPKILSAAELRLLNNVSEQFHKKISSLPENFELTSLNFPICSTIPEEQKAIQHVLETLHEGITLCKANNSTYAQSILYPALARQETFAFLPQEKKQEIHELLSYTHYLNDNLDRALQHTITARSFNNSNKDLPILSFSDNNSSSTVIRQCIGNLRADSSSTDYQDALEDLCDFAHAGSMEAQCKLIGIYLYGKYNVPVAFDKALHYCEQFVINFALKTMPECPLERFIVPVALETIEQSSRDEKIQRKTSILSTYYNAFEAIKSNNCTQTNLRKALLKNKTVPFFESRSDFIKIFNPRSKSLQKKIRKSTLADQDFLQFLASDRWIIRSISKQMLACPENYTSSEVDAIHWILGIDQYHHHRNFEQAREHFTQCTNYRSDLYAQALLLTANNSPMGFTQDLKISLPLLKKTSATHCDEIAKSMIMKEIHEVGPKYVKILLRNLQYSHACELTHCLIQLPETRESACELFISIEKNMSEQPEYNYSRIKQGKSYKTLHDYLQKITKGKHERYSCQTLAKIVDEQIRCPHTPEKDIIQLKKDYLVYADCSHHHKSCLTQEQKNLCANYAAEIGLDENSIAYIDRAIEYGNTSAYYHKVVLLNQSTQRPSVETIIDLLQKHTEKGTDALRSHSYEYIGLQSADNPKRAFECFTQAAHLGNYFSNHLLAAYYISGIKNDDEAWYVKPDKAKAIECLDLSIATQNNPEHEQALYTRMLLLYERNKYEKALEDGNSYLACQTNKSIEEITCSFIIGAIKMLSHKDRLTNIADLKSMLTSCIPYFRQAKKQLDDNIAEEYITFITSLLHSKPDFITTMSTALGYIIEQKATSAEELDFCYIMSYLCGLSNVTSKKTDVLALEALKHAADNNHLDSQLFFQQISLDNASAEEKIYYLEKAKLNNPELAKNLQMRLNNTYPCTVAQQTRLIDFLITKDTSGQLLHNYLSNMYSSDIFPVTGVEKHGTLFGQICIKTVIEKFLKNPILDALTKSFLKKPSTSSELHATMFLGSLLSCSNQLQHLLQGAYYLSTVQKHLQCPNDHIDHNLGITYYKLALYFLDKNHLDHKKAVFYLQKASDLSITPAQIDLSELWLNKLPEAQIINKNTIFGYLQVACVDNQDPRPHTLLKKYYEQNIQLSPETASISVKAADKKIKLSMEGNDLINKLSQHSLCKTIVDPTQSTMLEDFEYASKLIGAGPENDAKAFDIFQKMADQNPPYAPACLMHALHIPHLESSQRLQYVINGLTNGITKSKEKDSSLFHNRILLILALRFINEVISNNLQSSHLLGKNQQHQGFSRQSQMFTNNILKKIKSTLAELNINLVTFSTLYKYLYGRDLTKQAGWK